MSFKWPLFAVAALVVGVGGSVLYTHLKDRAPAAPARKPGAVLLVNDNGEVTISGKIRPQHITPVSADEGTDGDLDSFEADVGQDVFEGQVLARIGPSGLDNARGAAESAVTTAEQVVQRADNNVATARMEYSRAEADRQRSQMALDRIRTNFEKQQTTYRAGASPRQAFEKAQREYESARDDLDAVQKAARAAAEQVQAALSAQAAAQKVLAQKNQELNDAKDNMQSAEVRSPVDGLVVARNGDLGKPPAGELFEIATDMFALEVVLEPDPPILARIHQGQQALVLIPDLQSAGIPGSVKAIQGTQVIVEFESTLAGIKPGMVADVRLKL